MMHRQKQSPRTVWLYKRADWEALAHEIQPTMNDIMEKDSITVEELWLSLKTALLTGVKKYIPSKQSKSRPRKPWISPQLDKKLKKKKKLLRKSKKYGWKEVEERFNHLKRETQRDLRREHNQYVENLLQEDGENTSTNKKFWSYIKHKRSDNSGIGTLKVNSVIITDPKEKAEALNQQFQSVFSAPSSLEQSSDLHQPQATNMERITITENGVISQLKKLNPYKATGPDDLSPRVLKELAYTISGPLTKLYQMSLDTSTVPLDWKKARVSPIFKKGDKYLTSNYRPISLTCVACKILEHIVISHLTSFLERDEKLTPQQHGFRSRRSCESQLVELTCHISALMDEGKEVDACFLDFSKAFDKVDHIKLIHKLRATGANNQTVDWIADLLKDRTQVVVVDGHASSPCAVTSGVPQGSVVGPILFLVYINDLPGAVKSHVRLFADDTVIYNTADKSHQLQKDLEALEDWEERWCMEFNPQKCEHLKFSRKRQRGLVNTFTLHQTTMDKTDAVKYLGVKLEKSLRWNQNISLIIGKASCKLGYIRRTIPPNLSHLRDRAYRQLLRPTMEYSCSVWDSNLTTTQKSSLEAIQRRAARMVHNIKRTDHTTSTTQLIKDLEWDTLENRRVSRRLGLFRAMHFDEVATNISDFIKPHCPTIGYSRRHHHQYMIPHCNTKSRNSFMISTAKLWNGLPPGSRLLEAPPVAG